MIQLLRNLIVLIAFVGLPQIARAACTALPYTFTNGVSAIDANSTNANNQSLQACVTNIDWTQIGTAGLLPSQLLPTTSVQATFGGTVGYTFPAGLSVTNVLTAAGVTANTVNATTLNVVSYIVDQGGIIYLNPTNTQSLQYTGTNMAFSAPLAATVNGNVGYVPPVYFSTGGSTNITEHVARGTITISIPSGTTQAAVNVTLTGASAFTSVSTYQLLSAWDYTATLPSGWNIYGTSVIAQRVSGTGFTLYASNAATSTSTGTVVVDWVAFGI